MSRELWQFPPELQPKLVEGALSRYGRLIGSLTTPNSIVFTFDGGPGRSPRYVVAKTIRIPTDSSGKEANVLFRRALYEVNAAYPFLHHQSIHRIAKVEVHFGAPFLISPKRYSTLDDVIRHGNGALPLEVSLEIIVQIAHGLNYCRKNGLIAHQDLKPQNIFIERVDKMLVVDDAFPMKYIAKVADFELANAFKALGLPQGSRPYMAPEQFTQEPSHHLDFSKVDVFACGIILYEMLTGGRHPVGEQISLVWPTPATGKSRKWTREDPWKKWARAGDRNEPLLAVQTLARSAIGMALHEPVDSRCDMEEFEAMLWQALSAVDSRRFGQVQTTLAQFDAIAEQGEETGWPAYDEALRDLADWLSKSSPSG